jgi:UTP--glucose-1-phosphate uridylyltransferase
MKIRKAVITAAGPAQRHLPLQTVMVDGGRPRTALQVLLDEVYEAGVEKVAVVVAAGDVEAYWKAAGAHGGDVVFLEQAEPLGYGDAICQAAGFVGEDAFLLMVSDHLYLSYEESSCVSQLLKAAEVNGCSVSAVQATREGKLPLYGAVGGWRVPQAAGFYEVKRVIEKPSPTLAEQHLTVPGLRAGQYLCFFGMHALSGHFMKMLGEGRNVSETLQSLAEGERYLAYEVKGRRFNLDEENGLLIAQLGLALNGPQRDGVLAAMVELLATSVR